MSASSLDPGDDADLSRTQKPSGIAVLDQPVTAQEKSRYVRSMFDAIAPRYDLLNTLLSMRIHYAWRRMAARCAALASGDSALDVCTGTGDFAAELRRIVGGSGTVYGVDFSLPMLQNGTERFARECVLTAQADALSLPFAPETFDAAVIGFGLRNVTDPHCALAEMSRVVRDGGRVVCLEFSQPKQEVFRALYDWYGTQIMPRIGGLVSGVNEAYTYLPQSVARWKTRDELSQLMRAAGLVDVRTVDMTFGIVCIHVGTKKDSSWQSEQ